ncbi:branched-chain amino acid ABC transporter permease [Bradyrhizobium lablabi]|uniref:branched-chain amino acid ABC transporter permease n=1 Tax=Bradyrhizobium lablabi TaxID=722472 RepID=UPI001BA9B0FA|nr:branched-chain amino acid ABC transporter permease [Bradyrhizobium lablabi]MBR1125677.1 branched-chain amino acid ABC transporter permease [Bradyrhizobium lablabi]
MKPIALVARALPYVGWLLLAALIFVPAYGGSRYLVYIGTLIALQAALATSLNLIVGYAGQFAMSHAAFYGFGAYASAILINSAGLTFWWSIPAAMLAAAAIAAIIGYPALRYTGGVYLALITFAFGELARLTAANWQDVTGGPMGMRITYAPEALFGFNFANSRGMYWIAVAMLLVTLAVVFFIQRSRFGRALIAVREDEVLASFLGIDVMRHKMIAYVISSALAAMVGTLYAPMMSFISPELLSVHETISLVGIVILGGAGTLAGPIVGTFVFLGIPELLRIESLYRLVVLGVVIVLVVLLMPQGIVGVANRVLKRWQRPKPAPPPAEAEN